MTYPTSSNSRSSARVASTFALGTCAARATNTTRAASPPFATSTLFSPAPANVARRANASDVAPIGRRKTHQRTPFTTMETRFSSAAPIRSGSDADCIVRHVSCQFTLRAKSTSMTRISPVSPRRSVRATTGFMSDPLRSVRERREAKSAPAKAVEDGWQRFGRLQAVAVGVVAVAVVEEQDGAGVHSRERSVGDDARAGPRRIPHAERPAHGSLAERRGDRRHPRAPKAVWSAEVPRTDARGADDLLRTAGEIVA